MYILLYLDNKMSKLEDNDGEREHATNGNKVNNQDSGKCMTTIANSTAIVPPQREVQVLRVTPPNHVMPAYHNQVLQQMLQGYGRNNLVAPHDHMNVTHKPIALPNVMPPLNPTLIGLTTPSPAPHLPFNRPIMAAFPHLDNSRMVNDLMALESYKMQKLNTPLTGTGNVDEFTGKIAPPFYGMHSNGTDLLPPFPVMFDTCRSGREEARLNSPRYVPKL